MIPRSVLRSTRIVAIPRTVSSTVRQALLQRPSAQIASSRYISSTPRRCADTDAAKADAKTETLSSDQATPASDETSKKLEAKEKELIDVTDKWKRSIAEFRNLQAQTQREVAAAKNFAIQRFAKDLIESVDNLDRALGTVPQEKLTGDNADLKSLHDGLRMTETILMNTLKRHGLERFDPSEQGDKFDPNKHEATFQVPQPDKEDGTVFHTQQKGFALNGRILRAAKVGVVKNS